jgi:hypothetical protein
MADRMIPRLPPRTESLAKPQQPTLMRRLRRLVESLDGEELNDITRTLRARKRRDDGPTGGGAR